jgi:hypothetical protein
MKITARLLKTKGACKGQVAKFTELFPKGVEVTEALCVIHAQDFDWNWAAYNLLPPELWKVYMETKDAASKVYDKARDAASKVYNETKAAAFGKIIEGI